MIISPLDFLQVRIKRPVTKPPNTTDGLPDTTGCAVDKFCYSITTKFGIKPGSQKCITNVKCADKPGYSILDPGARPNFAKYPPLQVQPNPPSRPDAWPPVDDNEDDEGPPLKPSNPPVVTPPPPFSNPVRTTYYTGMIGTFILSQTFSSPPLSTAPMPANVLTNSAQEPQVVWRSSGPFPDDEVMTINQAEFHLYDINAGVVNQRQCYFISINSDNFANEILYVKLRTQPPNGKQIRFSGPTLDATTLEPVTFPVLVAAGDRMALRPTRKGINYFACTYWLVSTLPTTTNKYIFSMEFDGFYDSRCKFVNQGCKDILFSRSPEGQIFTPATTNVTGGVQTICTEDNNRFQSTIMTFNKQVDDVIRIPPTLILKSYLPIRPYPTNNPDLWYELRYAEQKATNAFSPRFLIDPGLPVGTKKEYYAKHVQQHEFEVGGVVTNELL